ncbi:hypothetical protein M9Y10_002278 [Tritrichomonas musculus]|uniref:DnaK protein n=1 Tax=Tritrichomonas musculus TaxID=1915356 RepID=A0ABR2L9C3_9EUKA
MSIFAFGIDLGTTFSSIAYLKRGKPCVINIIPSKVSIPSAVAYQKDKPPIVGYDALDRQIQNPELVIYDTKRMLGRRFQDEEIQKISKAWPFKIEKSDNDDGIIINLENIGKKIRPYEASGEILKYLVDCANQDINCGHRINDVVITIPANFNEIQRQETKKAADYAGLHVLRLISEPAAAGISYSYNCDEYDEEEEEEEEENDETKKIKEKRTSNKKYYFIFDFGGGTLDVSLLTYAKKEFNVVAVDGDPMFGGRDIDELLVNHFIAKEKLENYYTDPLIMKEIRDKMNLVKIELSTKNEYKIDLNINNTKIDFQLSLEDFDKIISPVSSKLLDPVNRILNLKKLQKSDIKHIILVGGSSNMKFVEKKLKDFFGEIPYHGVDCAKAIAEGAAIVASKAHEKAKTIKDVCPYNFGDSTLGGQMSVIIKKNTPLPVTEFEKFTTVFNYQETIQFDVYEGDSENVKDNNHLGSFYISGLPREEAGEIEVTVFFELDQNGILSAHAEIKDHPELRDGIKVDVKIGDYPSKQRNDELATIKMPKDDNKSSIEKDESLEKSVLYWRLKVFFINAKSYFEEHLEDFHKCKIPKRKLEDAQKYIAINQTLLSQDPESINATELPDIINAKDCFKNFLTSYFMRLPKIPNFLNQD